MCALPPFHVNSTNEFEPFLLGDQNHEPFHSLVQDKNRWDCLAGTSWLFLNNRDVLQVLLTIIYDETKKMKGILADRIFISWKKSLHIETLFQDVGRGGSTSKQQ